MRKTKILATIGPSWDSDEMIATMLNAGVNIIRFNTKHNTFEWHDQHMQQVQRVADSIGKRVALYLDLQGPEVRINTVPEAYAKIEVGQTVIMSTTEGEGITLDHPEVFETMTVGQTIYADDGFLEFKVSKVDPGRVEMEVIDGGGIKPRKTMNFPGMHLPFPALIDRDMENLELAVKNHVDMIGLSFVRSGDDIKMLREVMKQKGIEAAINAKIEHPDAVEHFDEILAETDSVCIARGDLGVEYPFEEVPGIQKLIIQKSREEGRPVIVATQMMESMIENPRPTRAEVSDVANAVYDSADGVWLSGETATGAFPRKVIEAVDRICSRAEAHAQPRDIKINWVSGGQEAAIVAAAQTLYKSYTGQGLNSLVAYVVLTQTGRTAQFLSRMRPQLPIIALSNSLKTIDQLNCVWGVKAYHYEYQNGEHADVSRIVAFLNEMHETKSGDRVIMIYGEDWGMPGKTSVVRLQDIV